jgi:uncharacterized protein (DUF2147 family)
MKFRLTFALAILFAATTFARAEPTVAGFWESRDSDGKTPTAWFLFSGKNEVYSARLVKGFKPKDENAPPPKELCDVCPGKKKNAHVMGLTLFWGMKRDGLHYTEGSVLDPRDGSVYHALMNLSDDGQELEVRGYLGIPMLGKSQTWYRLPDDTMKKEEIPKEMLAGDEKKPRDTVAEKPKSRKKDKEKAKVEPPADTEAAVPAEEPAK